MSKQLIDAVVAAGDGAGGLVFGVDELASAMTTVMEHVEANGFEQCGNRACTYCYPFAATGN